MKQREIHPGGADGLKRMCFCLCVSRILKTAGADRKTLRRRIEASGYQANLDHLATASACMDFLHVERARHLLAQGINACCITDSQYPERLRQISASPLVLYYRGAKGLDILGRPLAITVVGTRSPTAYGRAVTRQIVAELCLDQSVIISGLARGIDGLAHQVTLENDGIPVAVVAQGVDVAYPSCHAGLMEQIAQKGIIISEHEPGTRPKRNFFPARNRILSGLCDVVAVMEAKERSGTLITAGFAADQGRDVFAVPGSILMQSSDGCHQLLREGAGVLAGAEDLLENLRPNADLTDQKKASVLQQKMAVDPSDLSLLRQLAGVAWRADEIAGLFHWTLQKTQIWLSQQELAGTVLYERGRFFLTEAVLFCI